MYKFVIGTPPQQGMVVILKPDDLRSYRERPIDDHTRLDGRHFGRPEVFGLMTYSPNRNMTRSFIRKAGFQLLPRGEGDLFFNGAYQGQRVMGVVFSEKTFLDFEAKPLGDAVVTLRGAEFGVPDFTIMIVYAKHDRPVVGFLRQLGVPVEKIATDPTLRSLWASYGEEVAEQARALLETHGRAIPRDEQVDVSLGTYTGDFTEEGLLAARGEELAWFAAHPDERDYFRRARKGEFPPDFSAEWVHVIKTDEPGVRLRIPMNRQPDGSFVEATGPKR